MGCAAESTELIRSKPAPESSTAKEEASGAESPTSPVDTEPAFDGVPLDPAAQAALNAADGQQQGLAPRVQPVYRAVLGRDASFATGHLCGDLGAIDPGKDSRLIFNWKRASDPDVYANTYFGTCAELAIGTAAAVAQAHYNEVPGIPGKKCATLPDYNSSMWFDIGSGVRTARKFAKNCSYHASYPREALVPIN